MMLLSPFTGPASSASSAAKSAGQSVGLYAAAGLIGLTGTGFLLAAGYIWLADELSPLAAALTIGIILLLVAAIIVGSLAIRTKQAQKRKRAAAADTAAMASTLSLANIGLRLISRAKGP